MLLPDVPKRRSTSAQHQMAEEKKQVPTKVVGMDSVCAKPEKEIKEVATRHDCRDWATNPEANTRESTLTRGRSLPEKNK